MNIRLAESAGFCFGVKRAIELTENQSTDEIITLGDIIHNSRMIDKLEKIGIKSVKSIDNINDGDRVVIRAHGEPRATYNVLANKKCDVIDATCPFVSKIHKIVKLESDNNRHIIIVGSRNHPEVIGIQGWCENSIVVENIDELKGFLSEYAHISSLSIVAQTTINRQLWDEIIDFLKKVYTNVKIFDTICRATDDRQLETRELAQISDLMIVIGDRKSSNSKRLYEISKSICNDVLFIEGASELDFSNINLNKIFNIGITAGASTPAFIIEEVVDMINENNSMENFAELLEQSFKTINTGDKVVGQVTNIGPTEIEVDLGVKHAGYIHVGELSDDPYYNISDNIKVGQDIEAVVVRVNDVEGYITLSKKRVEAEAGWEKLEKASDDQEILDAFVVDENRGGLVATVFGVRVFIPASQTGVARGLPISSLLKTKVKLKIMEINRQRRRVVGSIRIVKQQQRAVEAEKVWSKIAVGDKFKGIVKSITDYGVFVDIGGVDGMVYISELSWKRVKHPSDIVNIGDTLETTVISLDTEKKKISLSAKNADDNPWEMFKTKYPIDSIVNVRIIKFMPFGAFAEIIPGVDGLIHISQICDRRISKPSEELTLEQHVDAQIIEIDDEKRKVSLSIRSMYNDMVEE